MQPDALIFKGVDGIAPALLEKIKEKEKPRMVAEVSCFRLGIT